MLRRTVREFAEREIAPRMLELDEKEEFSCELTRAMGELGLFGMTVSPDYGGHGLDYLSYIIAVEEIARVNGSQAATVAAENSLGIGPLYYYGSEAQKRRYLPDLCAGKRAVGLRAHRADGGIGRGRQQDDRTPRRRRLGDQRQQDLHHQCRDADDRGLDGAMRDRHAAGRQQGAQLHHRRAGHARFHGADACIARWSGGRRTRPSSTSTTSACRATTSSASAAAGLRQMLETLDSGRLSIAAMGLGGAQGAFDAALAYARERVQFGKPISQFQANAFKLADMATEIETTRNLLYKACWLRDQRRAFRKEAAMAKLWASEVMRRVTHAAVQIFGGYGLMEEYPVARLYRDQRLLEIGEGTSEVQRLVISRLLGCYD